MNSRLENEGDKMSTKEELRAKASAKISDLEKDLRHWETEEDSGSDGSSLILGVELANHRRNEQRGEFAHECVKIYDKINLLKKYLAGDILLEEAGGTEEELGKIRDQVRNLEKKEKEVIKKLDKIQQVRFLLSEE